MQSTGTAPKRTSRCARRGPVARPCALVPELLESRTLLSGSVAVRAIAPATDVGTTYDLAKDFSATANPNGAWSYGEIVNGVFYADAAHAGGLPNWEGSHSQSFSQTQITGGDGSQFSGYASGPVALIDSTASSGIEAAVRWTAPAGATYQIQGTYDPMNSSGNQPVEVLQNGSVIASGFSSPPSGNSLTPTTFSFNQSVVVKAGDTIDFVVEQDPNAGFSGTFDNAELEATITQTSAAVSGGGGNAGSSGLTVVSSGKLSTKPFTPGKHVTLTQTLTVADAASTTFNGTVTASLYLAVGTSVDSGSILLSTLHKKLKLKANKHTAFAVKATKLPAALSAGTYHVVVELTDPSGIVVEAASGGTISVS